MSNNNLGLNDIFDLPEGNFNDKPVKKERKKPELSEEKRSAMLERLAKGREMRAQKLAEKKGIVKEVKEVKTKIEDHEAERLAFVNMMAGKSKPSYSQSEFKNETKEKFERPKKKVYETKLSREEKPVVEIPKKEEPKEQIKNSINTNMAPIIINTPIREPVIIRTFKKPIWG
jgi:hypothetical protein